MLTHINRFRHRGEKVHLYAFRPRASTVTHAFRVFVCAYCLKELMDEGKREGQKIVQVRPMFPGETPRIRAYLRKRLG